MYTLNVKMSCQSMCAIQNQAEFTKILLMLMLIFSFSQATPAPFYPRLCLQSPSNQIHVFTTNYWSQRNQWEALMMTLSTDWEWGEGADSVGAKTDRNWAIQISEPGFSVSKIGHRV